MTPTQLEDREATHLLSGLAKAGSGVMLAWFPPSEMAAMLAVEGGEEVDQIHLTILYLGKNIDPMKLANLEESLREIAGSWAPLSGSIGGAGRFPPTESSDDKAVLIRLVDVARLEALRERLITICRKFEIEPVLNHGYTPHITIRYTEPGEMTTLPDAAEIPIEVTGITLCVAGDREFIPFTGNGLFKGGPGSGPQGGKKSRELSSSDMEQLTQQGYTFRQRQFYSQGVKGDIPVHFEPRGPMWMRKPGDALEKGGPGSGPQGGRHDRDHLEAWVAGGQDTPEQRAYMSDLIDREGKDYNTLYRGLQVREGSPILSAKPGDPIDFGVSSFSTDMAAATKFANEEKEKEDTAIVVRVLGPVKGLDINEQMSRHFKPEDYGLSGIPFTEDKEITSKGQFEVVRRSAGMIVVRPVKARKLAKAAPPAGKDDSPAAKRARKKIEQIAKDKLSELKDTIPQDAAAAYDDNDNAKEALDDIDLGAFDTLAGDIEDSLHEVFLGAGGRALDSLKVDNENITHLFNKDAADYARQRGAEMVGKKWVNDRLVDNPNPKWAITESTRDGIKEVLTRSYTDGMTPAEVKRELADSYLFGEGRAGVIARTETARASSAGSMSAWKRSGLVLSKMWQMSNVHDSTLDCDCEANSEEGFISIDEDWESGDDNVPSHPNCSCSIIPGLGDPDEDPEDALEDVVGDTLGKGGPGSGPHPSGAKESYKGILAEHDRLKEHSGRVNPMASETAVSNYRSGLHELLARTEAHVKIYKTPEAAQHLAQASYHLMSGKKEYGLMSIHNAIRAISHTAGARAPVALSRSEEVGDLEKYIETLDGWMPRELVSAELVKEFNPDEPRDDHGRWGEGGLEATFQPSEKMARAIASQVRTGKKEQDIAERSEAVLSKALGIPRTADNSAFDLRNDELGIEVKTLVNGKNEKITMSKAALGRKLAEQRGDELKGYTIVVDRRAGGMTGNAKYYYKEGFGSFRLSTMTSATLAGIREVIRGNVP